MGEKITIILFVLISLLFASCDFIRMQSKFGSRYSYTNDSIYRSYYGDSLKFYEFNETTRLFYLCKVWGFVKYFHQSSNVINVDSILLANIPTTIAITDKGEYNKMLLKVINSIQVSGLKGKNPYPHIDDYCLINDNWMNDTICIDEQVKVRLEEIFLCHNWWSENKFVYNRSNEGTIRQRNEKNYKTFEDEKIRLLGLFRYWNVINYFYPSKIYLDESWDKALYESIPLFRSATAQKEYHREIYRLTNRLKDSHSSYPSSIDGTIFGAYRPNFRMMNIQDSFVISEIRIKENNIEDFRTGDIILSINGQNVHQLYDSLSTFTGGGNYWSKQRFICNALLSTYDSITTFSVLRRSDTLIIHSKNKRAWDLHLQEINLEKENGKKPLYHWISDSVAYFDLTSANGRNFRKNFSSIKLAKAIILDLRCYPTTSVLVYLEKYFVPPIPFFANITYADARFPGMLRQHRSSGNLGHKNYYKGKVIVLVNELTESFSEYTTMLLQANPNTITVGYSSSGADGNVSTLEFPGGINTIYTGIGIYYPDMTPTQRVGVKIDYVIEPNIKNLQKGIDILFDTAIKLTFN